VFRYRRPHRRSSHAVKRTVLGLATAVTLLGGVISGSSAAGAAAQPAASAAPKVERVCSATVAPHHATCLALRRTDVLPNTGTISPDLVPSGYGRPDLLSAYNLPSAGGSGLTVAIVDAYDDPSAESDLATYRSTYGLPACTTANGCFKKINQNGGTAYPPSDSGWAGEISLDVDMVSAVCPDCHILLVEATSPTMANLGTAVNQAVSQGAKFVSNSYGGGEDGSESSLDASYFNHPGVVITASSGDSNFQDGASYPASSQYVTAVGGTRLVRNSTARGWGETVWNTNATEGTGSGCSSSVSKPSWQHDSGCARRMEADVSAVADPATGVAVYQTFGGSGWAVYGGTSASAPIIAAVYALAGAPAASDRANSFPYSHTANLYDVTSGNNGSCSPAYFCVAQVGYDGPTGLGTPNGVAAFSAGTSAETVSVTNPGNKTGTVGTAISSLQIAATDSLSKPLTFSATGLPAGLAISSSGLITGTPTTAATYSVTVTASSGTASGSTTFTWVVSPVSGGCSAAQLFGNPGFETGAATPWTLTAGVLDSGSSEPAHSGNWKAWLDGYGTTHTDSAVQKITIPAGCASASLTFWLHIDTAETTTTTQFDKLQVQVLNSANAVVGTPATFSNLNHASGYQSHTYSLNPYIGQTISIKFLGTEDSSLQTSFVLDDTALNVN